MHFHNSHRLPHRGDERREDMRKVGGTGVDHPTNPLTGVAVTRKDIKVSKSFVIEHNLVTIVCTHTLLLLMPALLMGI